MSEFKPTAEQLQVLQNEKKNLVVSASAGSGKTAVLIENLTRLVCDKQIPVKRMLVLTFTRVAAQEAKDRLQKSLSNAKPTRFVLDQIDDLPNADICTIDSFCEKVIKKNIDKISLDQNFSVLDEGQSTRLKQRAFERASEKFLADNIAQYWQVYNCFKRNKTEIFQCLLYIDDFLNASNDPVQIMDKTICQPQDMFLAACQIGQQQVQGECDQLLRQLQLLQTDDDKLAQYKQTLAEIISSVQGKDLQALSNWAGQTEIPITPRSQDKAVAGKLSALRSEMKKQIDYLCKFHFEDPLLQQQQNFSLANALISFYKVFKTEYDNVKRLGDFLDFADIEKLCGQLLENVDVRQQLQSAYDYVFIDEYQDTNRLQEEIIKQIAQNCHFVAVGDPKQSIYGFRNATMEIMKQDLSQNSSAQDGKVVFLHSNFRSDKRVLDFINSIFVPIMKEENVGIDYKSTSLLEGKAEYEMDKNASVQVCFLQPQEQSTTPKDKIYSVIDAALEEDDKDVLEAEAISKYVDDMLVQKIYDVKQKTWRKVELNDIVVLMRSRGTLMETIARVLTEKGYPVLADEKKSLAEEEQVELLLDFLRLTLDEPNEVALVAVLLSKLGGLDTQQMADIALGQGESLTEKINASGNEKVEKLRQNIEIFKRESEIFGVDKAFERLFDKTNYFAYLKHLGQDQYLIVEKFLQAIRESGQRFNRAGIISYVCALSSGSIAKPSDSQAIRLLTIHGSKGSEYPIVVLAGCGKPIISANRKPYLISNQLGLATMEYDQQNLLKFTTPAFEANKILKRKAEYIDELMIFYVALTRAQNKLVLTGGYDLEKYNFTDDLFRCKSYFDWLLAGLGQSFADNLVQKGEVTTPLAKFFNVQKVEFLSQPVKQIYAEEDKELSKKIQDYLDFRYKNIELSTIEFKNSVTSLLKLQIDDEREERILPVKTQGYSANEVGTIYHTALKEIDFAQIDTLLDLQNTLARLCEQGYLLKEEAQIIDIDILYKDITILKQLTAGATVYKEQAFMMALPLNKVLDKPFTDKVLVQGVVDMFALGKQNILVDYKFSSINSSEKLLEKYKKQLQLYAKAIEKAYKIKLDKKYIFNIKNCKLIEFFEK